jgi:hypothetical protein
MKNQMTGWMVGGLITVSVLGMVFGVNSIGNAAAKSEPAAAAPSMMMQNRQTSPAMMNSPDMQKQCGEMMANPDTQKTMKGMMQQPQLQTIMMHGR